MTKLKLILLVIVSLQLHAEKRFEVVGGKIDFTTNAPLELIKANSEFAQGIIDPNTNRFAFIVSTGSFKGFNSELQRQHFNEKYMESEKYYQSSFTGQLEDLVNFKVDGVHKVNVKGTLLVHGKKQPRTIPSTITISRGKVKINSEFNVALADHDISIPKIISHKLATEIFVKLEFLLEEKEKK